VSCNASRVYVHGRTHARPGELDADATMAASHGPAAAALSGAVATRNREVSERAREEGRSKRQGA
jgi:hypothetical protein